MTESQNAKLEAIKNRVTRYELALWNEVDGSRVRLCYTSRKNRAGLVDAIRRNGAELQAFTGAAEFALYKHGKSVSAARLGSWHASFTGRTQRDAILSGELPWFWSGRS